MHDQDLTSFHQARHIDEWLQALNKELIALDSTYTWTIFSLQPDKHDIGTRQK